MTDEELEKKAEEYLSVERTYVVYSKADVINAYTAGAKENGVVYHDLRKHINY